MNRSMIHALLFSTALLGLGACAGEQAEPVEEVEAPAAAEPVAGPTAAPSAEQALLDPNEATREQLVSIEGIDAATADAIIAGRPYENMLEVDQVLAGTLDEAQRETVYRSMWKRIDLNTASNEEILLIPGVGERMAYEFDEYRPYRAIEQFRREIGKYVDDEEVARLERYVEIR